MPFAKGDPNINRKGRIPGSGISITTEIKKKLTERPKGEKKATYLQLLIQKVMDKAVKDGDHHTIKQIWNYVDGLPQGSLDLTTAGNPLSLVIERHEEGKEDKTT